MAGQSEVPTSVDVNLETGAPPCTSVLRLFVLFSYIGLSSFGGAVPAWIHRAFVERRAWLDEREFSAALALARIVPGVNVVNLAVLVGNRLRGNRGATAAVTGLLLGPSLVAVGLAVLYRQFTGTLLLPTLLSGTSAAAVGLLIGMGISSGARLASRGIRSGGCITQSASAIVFLATMFVLVGVLRFPTVPTVMCVAPLSIAVAFLGRPGSPGETG
jgi:chromate transporter